MKRTRLVFACAVAFFAVANVASYFLRSDGFALRIVADGITRCGFPLIFWQRGGWVNYEDFYMLSFAIDVISAIFIGALVSRRFKKTI